MYKDMATILKPREGKRFKVSTFTLDYETDFFVCIRDGIKPGTYARLTDKETHQCVMSNTRMEQVTNREFVMNAHGKVLIGGLGIGMILLAIQDKPEVDSILVVEKYQEVIDLIKDQLPLNNKVTVIQGDIFEYEPKDKYNTIYLDIWNTMNDRRISSSKGSVSFTHSSNLFL